MNVNDTFRRLSRYWRLMVVCALLPPLVVVVVGLVAAPSYTATARVVVSASNPGTDTEADAVMNRATGIATSTAVVSQALGSLPVSQRAPLDQVIPEISVVRLGSSPVVDVMVTDPDPARATALAAAIGPRVVNMINSQGSQGASQLVAALSAQRDQLLDRRQQLARQLTTDSDSRTQADVSAQLSSLDQQLSDLGSSIGQAQSSSLSTSSAGVISMPAGAVRAAGHTASDAALALVLGVLAGVVLAAGIEFVVPRVVDARTYAREIEIAYLGQAQLDDPDSDDADREGTDREGTDVEEAWALDDPLLPTLLAQAAERNLAGTVLLVGPVGPAALAGLARRLDGRLPRRRPGDLATGTTSNGVVEHFAAGEGGLALRTSPQRTSASTAEIQVRTVDDTDATLDDNATLTLSAALVLVLPDRARYRDLDPVRDLERTTGWPLIAAIAGVRRRPGPTMSPFQRVAAPPRRRAAAPGADR